MTKAWSLEQERICALALALGGAIVFAYCVGSISSLAQEGSITGPSQCDDDVYLNSGW